MVNDDEVLVEGSSRQTVHVRDDDDAVSLKEVAMMIMIMDTAHSRRRRGTPLQ